MKKGNEKIKISTTNNYGKRNRRRDLSRKERRNKASESHKKRNPNEKRRNRKSMSIWLRTNNFGGQQKNAWSRTRLEGQGSEVGVMPQLMHKFDEAK